MTRVRTARTMLTASGLTVLGAIPPFLLGAQAVLMQRDLGCGAARLGVAVSVFFGCAALATICGVGVFTRLGPRIGVAVAGGLVALGGGAIAAFVTNWWALVVAMGALGVGNAACQATSNAAVATALPRNRRGLGFGIKQSAVPAAIMFGGLAVPTTTAVFGWRSTFVVIATAGLLVALVGLLRPIPDGGAAAAQAVTPVPPDRAPRGALLLCGAAIILASASANFLGAYLPSWAHGVGLSVEQAGLLLAVGSGTSVLMRILIGYRADLRYGANLPVVAAMTLFGAVCLALIGALAQPWSVALFGFLAFAVGWSWPGLFLFAVARVGRDSPTQAASVLQAGAFTGGAIGPALFGVIVSLIGFEIAWYVASLAFIAAAALVLLARRWFRLDLQNRPPAQPFGYGGGRHEPRFTTDPPL